MDGGFGQYAHSYEQHVEQALGVFGGRREAFLQIKADLLLRILREGKTDPSKVSLLDVGCGPGAMARWLVGRVKHLEGVDVSAEVVEAARASIPGAVFRHYSPPVLPYEDAAFDVVMAVCVLHHVSADGWCTFASEMVRVARPSGFVFVFEHNPLNPLTRLVVRRCAFDRQAVLLRCGRVARLLQAAGADRISTFSCSWLPSMSCAARMMERWLRRVPFGPQYAVVGRPSAARQSVSG